MAKMLHDRESTDKHLNASLVDVNSTTLVFDVDFYTSAKNAKGLIQFSKH